MQTFDSHGIYQFVDEARYSGFYDAEIAKRSEVGYPPFKHIAEIEVLHRKQLVAEEDAAMIVSDMLRMIEQQKLLVDVCGPVAALVYKIKDVYVQKIILKSFSRAHMIGLFKAIRKQSVQSSLFFTIDPVS